MSVLLDTDVVCELIRKAPDPAVAAWAADRPLEDLFFSAVGEAELNCAATILAAGRRRETLVPDIARMLRDAFENRVLAFDGAAASEYAAIAAARQAAGRPIGVFDGQIAAIARLRGMAVATRNASAFEGCGVEVMDPWRYEGTPHHLSRVN